MRKGEAPFVFLLGFAGPWKIVDKKPEDWPDYLRLLPNPTSFLSLGPGTHGWRTDFHKLPFYLLCLVQMHVHIHTQ